MMDERAGLEPPADLVARRAAIGAAVEAGYFRTDPQPEQIEIAGVRCLRFCAPTKPRGILLHLHGGAFRMGSPEQVGPFAAALAADCNIDVVCPAYRLAPEHPFPSGLNDALAVLAALAASGQPLVVSGDSAGGGLAAGLAALTYRQGYNLAGLALLSPWLDLTVTSGAYRTNADSDPLFSVSSATEAAALYLQGMAPTHSVASPLLVDVGGYPPTYVNVGRGEVLFDDSALLADKLREATVPVTFHPVADMEHVAVTRDRNLPGSAETYTRLREFISAALPVKT